jgi:patatin-like phospholipase/acyl hydrolase
MRGAYTATYLDRVAAIFAHRRGIEAIDIGGAFDLIVGTSTGGIVACALAAGVSLSDVVALYREHGRAIFHIAPASHARGCGAGSFSAAIRAKIR